MNALKIVTRSAALTAVLILGGQGLAQDKLDSPEKPAEKTLTDSKTAAPAEAKLEPGSVIYRCVDSQSKLWLVDTPMKDASCKKVEVPKDQNVMTPNPQSSLAQKALATDARQKLRGGVRDKYQTLIEAAEKKLADARAAREGGLNVKDDERIATQSLPDPGTKPDRQGRQTGRNGTVTCTTFKQADGSLRTFCPPVIVPGPNYYDRTSKLEKAVKDAEEELEKAREEYRRNAPD